MSAPKILCVNPNAAIDKTITASPFRLNEIHRPQAVLALPGGKGCNVARALKRLGDAPVVTGWVGGFAGQFIEAGLRREDIQTAYIHTDFESRTCLSILDSENNTLTELYEKGDPIPADKLEEFKRLFRENLKQYVAVTFCGSLPPGLPADFYGELIDLARAAGIPTLLDTGGDALKGGLAGKPRLIKPNRKEFADLIGKKLDTLADYVEAIAEVSARHHADVVLSLGAEGAIATNMTDVWQVKPPQIAVKIAVGSGDCLLAGIAHGLTHSFSFEESVRYGVAAGTANALTVGAGVFALEDFERVLSEVAVMRLQG